jgi:membrane-associated protease RseP (regulator of RpoE activity)
MLTATIAGLMLASAGVAEPAMRQPVTWLDYVLSIPEYYVKAVGLLIQQAFVQPTLLAQGVTFSLSLLSILAAHEAGHYIACRRYGVDATLPYFIPAPPLFLAGTFGAFIKIKSPIPSRRALFDIGLAGPLAGFIVALPVAVMGLLTAQHSPVITPEVGQQVITFNDPLLFKLAALALGVHLDPNSAGNPFYFAAWIGLLVTSLNLMPVGQLDGGHGTFAVFGVRAHKWLGRIAFLTTATLAILGWLLYNSPSGFLYTILLGIMLRVRHPQAGDETETLGRARIIIAVITLLVFILSFMPFPISIT